MLNVISKFDGILLNLMEPVRACPICPKCGSKRFVKLPGKKVTVKCRSCNKIIEI